MYLIYSEDVAGSLPSASWHALPTWPACKPCRMRAALLTAGPNPAIDAEDPADAGFTGSTVIADFASQADAQAWADVGPLCCGQGSTPGVRPSNRSRKSSF